ncbi:hypothetical protein pb186bvf_002403 [Paramecium bursaria]
MQSYQISILTGTMCQSGSPSQLTQIIFQILLKHIPGKLQCMQGKCLNKQRNNETNQTKSDTYGYLIQICLIIQYECWIFFSKKTYCPTVQYKFLISE